MTKVRMGASDKTSSRPASSGLKLAVIIGVVVVILAIGAVIAGVLFAGPALNFLQENKIKIDDKNGSIEVSTKDGQGTFSSKAQLPKDYPSDIPVYPGSQILYSVVKDNEGSNVTFRTSDNPQQVVAYYEEQLAQQGWKKTASQPSYFVSNIGSAEKSPRNLVIVVSEENKDGKASAIIVVTEKTR